MPAMCSSTCLFAMAPPEGTVEEFRRFAGPKGAGGEAKTEANKYEFGRYELHRGQMLQKLRWCRFFRDNELKCPQVERDTILPSLGTKLGRSFVSECRFFLAFKPPNYVIQIESIIQVSLRRWHGRRRGSDSCLILPPTRMTLRLWSLSRKLGGSGIG